MKRAAVYNGIVPTSRSSGWGSERVPAGSGESEEREAKRQRVLKPVVQILAYGEEGPDAIVVNRYHVTESDCPSLLIWVTLCTFNLKGRHPADLKLPDEVKQFLFDLMGFDRPKLPDLHRKCLYRGRDLIDPEEEGIKILKQQFVSWFH